LERRPNEESGNGNQLLAGMTVMFKLDVADLSFPWFNLKKTNLKINHF
jgi:hypothetical protein